MNIYKRKQSSGNKTAANRGKCTVLHDYEKDYASKKHYNGSSIHEPIGQTKNSISPSRQYAKNELTYLSSHKNQLLQEPQGQGCPLMLNTDSSDTKERMSANGRQINNGFTRSTFNSNTSVERIAPFNANRINTAQDIQQKQTLNTRCSFSNSYKKSAKKREYYGNRETEFEDSLAQCDSQISLTGEDQTNSTFNHYRPKRRMSKSPTKSPIKSPIYPHNPYNAATLPQRAQQSTSSTVLYDPHITSMQTSIQHPLDQITQKHSPINERHTTRNAQAARYQPPVSNSYIAPDKGSHKNNDTHFSFNNATYSSDLVNDSLQNKQQQLKQSKSSKIHTPANIQRSPEKHADFYFGAVEEKPKNEERRKVDILNYGRQKRDEIIEKLQLESAKHFQALMKARAKSGGNLKTQKNTKNTFKLQSEPQFLATPESEQQDHQRKSAGYYEGDCHRKKGKQQNMVLRLHEQTKSSQAKIETSLHGPYSNHNLGQRKTKGASVQNDLISESSYSRAVNTMTTPKTRTGKTQRLSRQDRSYRAAKGAANTHAAPLLMNQRKLTEDTMKFAKQHAMDMAELSEQKTNMNYKIDTRGSSLHCDNSIGGDDRSATNESGKRDIDLKKRRVELGNEYMNQGKKVSKFKKSLHQPVYEHLHQNHTAGRTSSLNTTKKKSGLRSTLKSNCEWQGTYSDGKSQLRKTADRRGGDAREEMYNQTQTIKEISDYEQVNWGENTMPPMMRINNNKGRESESQAKKQLSNKSNELEISKLHSSKSMICMQNEKHTEQQKIKTASFGNEMSLREFMQGGRTIKSPVSQAKTPVGKESSHQSKSQQQKLRESQQKSHLSQNNRPQVQSQHQSQQRRVHLTMGSNQKLKVVPNPNQQIPKKHRIHSLSEEEQMQFLRDKVAAVMLGYKTRKIYHYNRIIKQYRYEFRDLIQFAYTLKQEMAMNEGKPGQETQVETTKQLLLQSLKDLISKRHQFSKYFNRMLQNGTEWLNPSNYLNGDDTLSPLRASSIIKSAKKTQMQSRSQFINAGAKANQNLTNKKQQSAVAQDTNNRRSFMTKKDSYQLEKPRPKLTVSSHFESMDVGRTKSKKRMDSQQQRRTRQQSQMTFGGQTTTQSRQENLSFVEGQQRFDQHRATTEMGQVVEEDKPTKRHTFLKRGEKTRQVYDPQKAVMMDRQARRNKSVTDRTESHQLTTPKSAHVSRPVSVTRQNNNYTPNRMENTSCKRRQEGRGAQFGIPDGPRTPKTGGHMQRMREIRDTYQSPYKQLVTMNPSLNATLDWQGKNFIEINRDRVTSLIDQRKKSTSSRRCRNNELMDTTQSLANMSNQIKSPKIIDDHRRESSATRGDFVSKIPRLRCSLSRERCSAPGPRQFQPVLRKQSVNSHNTKQQFDEANKSNNHQTLPNPNPVDTNNMNTMNSINTNTRGSFNNYHKMGGQLYPSQSKSESKEVVPPPHQRSTIQEERQSSHHSHCHRVQQSNNKPSSQNNNRVGSMYARKQSGTSSNQGGGNASINVNIHNIHQKTPSLEEMNQLIKKQNQQYIQQKLHGGRGDSQGSLSHHKRGGSNYRSTMAAAGAAPPSANVKECDAQRDENRKAALDCVRKTREGLSAPRAGLGDKFHTANVMATQGATDTTISDISKITMQAQAKILQLSKSNQSNKVSLRYQHEKTPSDISAFSQPNNEKPRMSVPNNNNQQPSPSRGATRMPFTFQNQKTAAANVTSVDTTVSINIGKQTSANNGTAAPPAQTYNTSGMGGRGGGLVPNNSSPLLHNEPSGTVSTSTNRAGYHHGALGTGTKQTSRHQTCKPSERDSIMDQASNLQQLLEKFSPLRGMTFENKYVNKKAQMEKDKLPQDGQLMMVETGYTQTQESATQGQIPTSESADMLLLHDQSSHQKQSCPKEESPSQSKKFGASSKTHLETSLQYPVTTDECSRNDFSVQELTKLQLPSHNFCQMIGMFDQSHKCLDLGRSSNFDSISHTHTNLPSKRQAGDSPQQRQINMVGSDFGDENLPQQQHTAANNLLYVGSETLQKGDSMDYQVNNGSQQFNYERNQRRGSSNNTKMMQNATNNQNNYPGSQGGTVFVAPSSSHCSTSSFRICPMSIKNKSSMSSWQTSSRQSARHEQQQYVHQFDSRNITFNHSHISLPTNIQSYQQEKSLGQRRKGGNSQLKVLCQEKDLQSGPAASMEQINNDRAASRKSSPIRGNDHQQQDNVSQQRRIKYSPLKDNQQNSSRQGHISPYRRSIQQASPVKVGKENNQMIMEEQQQMPKVYELQSQNELGQYDSAGGPYLDCFEDEQQRNHELTLMMPQILSGPTRSSMLESRNQIATEPSQSCPNTSEQNLTRRRRSRGDRSRGGIKSRRSTKATAANFTKSNLYLTAIGGQDNQPRGTLIDIGSSTQVNQSLTSQITYQEKPVFAVPEAQPTPQRPQIFSKECTEESPSFSPKKAHQFSAVTTPQNKVKNASNWGAYGQNLSANKTPAGASGSRQRLTQTKRSRECQQNQTRSSPIKTPTKETRNYGRNALAENMNSHYRTGTHSQNSNQKQYNSSQKSVHGTVTPASGKKAAMGGSNMRQYQNKGVRDFSSYKDPQQFHNQNYVGAYEVVTQQSIEELTHLRN